MRLFLLVLEAKHQAPQYEPLLDVLERRMGGQRILRSAWIVEAAAPDAILNQLRAYLPVDDGLLIVPYQEPMLTRNLRT